MTTKLTPRQLEALEDVKATFCQCIGLPVSLSGPTQCWVCDKFDEFEAAFDETANASEKHSLSLGVAGHGTACGVTGCFVLVPHTHRSANGEPK